MSKGNGGQKLGPDKKFEDYVEYAVNNSDRASELIARSFYKILRKHGFDNSQIINTANILLDCLIKSLNGYKKKLDNTVVVDNNNDVSDDIKTDDLHVQ